MSATWSNLNTLDSGLHSKAMLLLSRLTWTHTEASVSPGPVIGGLTLTKILMESPSEAEAPGPDKKMLPVLVFSYRATNTVHVTLYSNKQGCKRCCLVWLSRTAYRPTLAPNSPSHIVELPYSTQCFTYMQLDLTVFSYTSTYLRLSLLRDRTLHLGNALGKRDCYCGLHLQQRRLQECSYAVLLYSHQN